MMFFQFQPLSNSTYSPSVSLPVRTPPLAAASFTANEPRIEQPTILR